MGSWNPYFVSLPRDVMLDVEGVAHVGCWQSFPLFRVHNTEGDFKFLYTYLQNTFDTFMIESYTDGQRYKFFCP